VTGTDVADAVEVILAARLALVRSALRAALIGEADLDVVAEVADSASLLDAAGRAAGAVALVDSRLTDCDGAGACAAIRAAELPVRVIVMSEEADPATLLEAVESGADGYVSHDASLKDLLDAIHRVNAGEAWVPASMLGTLLADLIRRQRAQSAAAERAAALTKREREVVVLLVDGLDHRAIAQTLVVSPHTARTHIQNVMDKLGAHSRLEVARLAIELGLVDRGPGPRSGMAR
jgi:DNA-binding NarL/FixJ family response regulator